MAISPIKASRCCSKYDLSRVPVTDVERCGAAILDVPLNVSDRRNAREAGEARCLGLVRGAGGWPTLGTLLMGRPAPLAMYARSDPSAQGIFAVASQPLPCTQLHGVEGDGLARPPAVGLPSCRLKLSLGPATCGSRNNQLQGVLAMLQSLFPIRYP